MKKAPLFLASCLALALCPLASAVCQAQSTALPSDAIAPLQAELARINQSMTQLVDMLRAATNRQSLEILLRRAELHYREMAPLQEDLRSARTEKRSLEEEHLRLQTIYNQLGEEIELGDPDMSTSVAGRKAMRRDLEDQIRFVKTRISNAEQRVAELESEVADGRRKVEVIEGMIDDRLRSWGR